ncbi:MAG: T9SS type A sorting domain-containing protein [Bacteroidales bacterium]|nr:T9SS type A sorting domain-containing protein [Bacteroidales bacterium]
MKKITILLMSLMVAGLFLNAQVAREKVLFEVFTGVNCPYCPAAANGIKDMIAAGKDIAPVAIHTSSFSIPQFYTAETNARAQYYGVSSYPTTKVDGVLQQVGGGGAGQSNYTAYLPLYNQRIGVTSPFTISLSYENVGGNNYEATVIVEKVVTTTYTNIVLQLFLTESNIPYSWMGMTDLNWVTRDIIPTQTGSPLDFSSSNTVTLTLPFTMNTAWQKENCDLVAFVQNNTGKEVLQTKSVTMNTPEYTLDAELFSVMNIPDEMCSGLLEPEVVIKNKGAEVLTSLNINFEINGAVVFTHHWTGALAFTDKAHIEIPEFSFDLLDFNEINVYISDPNNGADENPDNDHHGFEAVYPEVVSTYLILIMSTDNNPGETTWEVFDGNGDVIDSGGPYTQPNQFLRDTIYYTGAIGCHRFIMHDAGGNGLATYYTLRSFVDGTLKTIGNGAAFGYKEATEFSVDSSVGLDETAIEDNSFEIFPNPVVNTSTIHFNLKQAGNVTVELYNSTGKKVMEPANGHYNSGSNTLNLNVTGLDSGVYFLSMKSGNQTITRKIAVVR